MARAATTTKHEIMQVASEYFMNVGYSNTSPKMIAKKLNISPGNITYYFPSKENLLAAVVEGLSDFQWKLLEEQASRGFSSAATICLETMTVAVACDENEIARDLFTATFQSEICRNYLRKNHVERAKKIFRKECTGWTDEQFEQAEILIMGLQYASIIPTDADVSLKTRIYGVLNQILSIYNVDEETRRAEIESILDKDCRGISMSVLEGFKDFINKSNEEALEQMIRSVSEKNSKEK